MLVKELRWLYLQNFCDVKISNSHNFYLVSVQFRTKMWDTALKHGKVNLQAKHDLDWNNICENDSFSSLSRFSRYTDEKITQIYRVRPHCTFPPWTELSKKNYYEKNLSRRYLSQAASELLEFAPLTKETKSFGATSKFYFCTVNISDSFPWPFLDTCFCSKFKSSEVFLQVMCSTVW